MDPMWIPVLVACIVAIPPTLAVVVDIALSLRNRAALQSINVQLNGRLQEWLKMAEQKGFVAGVQTAGQVQALDPPKPTSAEGKLP